MLETTHVQCPYCWEEIEIVVDPSESIQDYVEDCFVCCRPIHLHVEVGEWGEVSAIAQTDDEAY